MSQYLCEQYVTRNLHEGKLVLVLHTDIYVSVNCIRTQPDPDIFYVNGKPGRAVLPYRVVPKKAKAREVIQQTEDGGISNSNARLIDVLPAQPQQQAQQNQIVQGEQIEGGDEDADPNQPHHLEAPLPAAYEPAEVQLSQELVSQDISDNDQEQVYFHADPNQPHHLEAPLPAAYDPEVQPSQELVSQDISDNDQEQVYFHGDPNQPHHLEAPLPAAYEPEVQPSQELVSQDISDNDQEQVYFHADPNQPHHLEAPLPAAYEPEIQPSQELVSQDISDNDQEQVYFHGDPNQPHHLEAPLPAAYEPEVQQRQELVSQEIQTELRMLHRQFLRINNYNKCDCKGEATHLN